MTRQQQEPSAMASAPGVPVTVNNFERSGTSVQLVTGIGFITAIMADNHLGTAAASSFLLDGTDATGEMLAVITSLASGGANFAGGTPGIYFKRGIYLYQRAAAQVVTVTYVPVLTPLT